MISFLAALGWACLMRAEVPAGLFHEINQYREGLGLRKLETSIELINTAHERAKEMLESNSLAPGRVKIWKRAAHFGFTPMSIGENMGKSYNKDSDGLDIFKEWLRSSTHRENLDDKEDYTHLGVYKSVGRDSVFVSAVFGKKVKRGAGAKGHARPRKERAPGPMQALSAPLAWPSPVPGDSGLFPSPAPAPAPTPWEFPGDSAPYEKAGLPHSGPAASTQTVTDTQTKTITIRSEPTKTVTITMGRPAAEPSAHTWAEPPSGAAGPVDAPREEGGDKEAPHVNSSKHKGISDLPNGAARTEEGARPKGSAVPGNGGEAPYGSGVSAGRDGGPSAQGGLGLGRHPHPHPHPHPMPIDQRDRKKYLLIDVEDALKKKRSEIKVVLVREDDHP